jgi:hypothetical protein
MGVPAKQLDRCIFHATAGGTGSFTVSAAAAGMQTPAAAGAVDGQAYSYAAQSADLTQWEYGVMTSGSSGTVFARTKIVGNSSGGTSAINFSTAPLVILTQLQADFIQTSAPILVTSAQLQALSTAPVTILPAPGAGFIRVIDSVLYDYTFGTTPYTNGPAGLWYNSNAAAAADTLDAPIAAYPSSAIRVAHYNETYDPQDKTNMVNQPITYFNGGTDYAGGDGTVTITVRYFDMPVTP